MGNEPPSLTEHNSNVEIDHSAFPFTFILEMYCDLCTFA